MLQQINDGVLERRVCTKMTRKVWLRHHPGWTYTDTMKMLEKFFRQSGLDPREVYLWILFTPMHLVHKYVEESLSP